MLNAARNNSRILVVRLGAMGDIIHTLPAVASLKHSFPNSRLTWVVEPQWAPLLEDNPFVDRVVHLRRKGPGAFLESWRDLRAEPYDFAVDFQGLVKSALVASASHADLIFGFHQSQTRERAAGLFYSNKTISNSVHVVDRALDLATAAGAVSTLRTFPIPRGRADGELPDGEFVLASPLAGWRQKQWPMSHFARLATMLRSELNIPLVLNGAPGAPISQVRDAVPHFSGIAGLIHATRRATAVLGVDSGPMHLAAALGKPGIAIFGPTDPARNGPYGDSLRVIRSEGAETTYKRGAAIDDSMRRTSPEEIFEVLRAVLGGRRQPAGCIA